MIAYIAGPYSSKYGKLGEIVNIIKAWRVAQKLWRQGLIVICPHANSALMTGLSLHEWYVRDLKILGRCNIIVMLPGWERSAGARLEKDFAEQNGILVRYE